MILAGDVGGTNVRLALFAVEGRNLLRSATATLRSRDYPGLKEAIASFLLSPRPPIEAAAFGVAGPVEEGRVRTTNLPWVVDEADLRKALGVSAVRVLNDIEAMAWGIEMLEPDDLVTLQEGIENPTGNGALIAAGTGLGEAFLFRLGGRLHPSPSEGGHADFAPTDEEMDAFLIWMRAQFGHVSVERVASGMGLERMYHFFHDAEHGDAAPHLPVEADAAAEVAKAAAKGSCAACGRAFDMFLRAYGAEAGNLALKAAATGGLYVGGGIAAKNLGALQDGRFLKSFRDKGRFASYLARVPVRVIADENAPLLGAALAAARTAEILP